MLDCQLVNQMSQCRTRSANAKERSNDDCVLRPFEDVQSVIIGRTELTGV